MSEELSAYVFDMLKRRVGSEVACKVWETGKPKVYTGVLVDVVPFEFINLSKQIIPFVGTNQAIEEINLDGNPPKMIYTNPNAAGYQGFTEKDVMGLVKAQEEILGKSALFEQMKERNPERKQK